MCRSGVCMHAWVGSRGWVWIWRGVGGFAVVLERETAMNIIERETLSE